MGTVGSRALRFGVFEVDLKSRELRKHGVHIKLSHQPLQALLILLEHRNEIVTREQLRAALWPDESWGDHDLRLNKVMNKIREALGDSIQASHFLETVPRVGYRFLASVERVGVGEDGPEETAPPLDQPPSRGFLPVLVQQTPPPPPARWKFKVALAAGIAFALGSGFTALTGLPKRARDHAISPYLATPLTTYPGVATSPSFSPDGKQVVFTLDESGSGGAQIYVISSDGGGARRLTNNSFGDHNPVWSPDGIRIAFLRDFGDRRVEIWTIGSDGGGEHKIADAGVAIIGEHPLCWAKDSNFLVISMRMPVDDPPALYLISAGTGERRRLTSPDVSSDGDWNPAISPGGRKLAFARSTPTTRDIFFVPLSNDLAPTAAPIRLTSLPLLTNTIAWNADGRNLVFSAVPAPYASRHLFRVDTSSLATSEEVVELGIEGTAPAISPDRATLVYVRENIHQTSILKSQPRPGGLSSGLKPMSLVSSTRQDFSPDLSPDGKRLAFSSVRSGVLEVWLANTDGSGVRRVTTSGGVTPKWSPDGTRIVFVSSTSGHQDVYVLEPDSGAKVRITSEKPRNILPSWSRDCKYVYFSSNRSGKWQIFKAPATGGPAVQITKGGGFYSVESVNGKEIYYTSGDGPADIRRAPVNGGEETVLIQKATAGFSALASGLGGLYYFSAVTPNNARMSFYSFAAKASSQVLAIDRPVDPVFSSGPGNDSVVYSQTDRWDCDLMRAPYRQ
jgi:Tol biopolymer transport system component/DNA-binding winged helix-turn-helix (wHTH) protein